MKRGMIAAVALVMGASAVACGPDVRDDQELRGFVARSELAPRTFTYKVSSKPIAYEITGAILDDFRYRVSLSSGDVPLIEQIVSDDALAVRLPTPAAYAGAGSFGHPDVDAALRSGRWVVDPAGAPPLVRTETGAAQGEPNPFLQAFTALATVRAFMGDAAGVREFQFEAIDYKPSQDPWEYPSDSAGQLRYDLTPPVLPRTEDQLGGQQSDVTAAQFRKTSVFVEDGRVYQICMAVDYERHEDFIKLKERGDEGGNPFHRTLLKRIRKGDTQTPIVPQERFLSVEYPESVEISLPGDAHFGRLEAYEKLLDEGALSKVLKPSGRPPVIEDCDRPEGQESPPP